MEGEERVEIEITRKSGISSRWLRKHLTLKNMFTFICSTLTFLLICQELNTFLFLRPTTTSKEEKEVDPADLPETLICLDPGFDPVALKRYGYRKVNKYYRGSLDGVKFVGWNGDQNLENKSSHAILEDALRVDKNFRSKFDIFYRKADFDTEVKANVRYRTLAYPHGRCLSISPTLANDTDIKSLSIVIKDVVGIQSITSLSLRVYFMDRINSVRIYPNDMEMTGEAVTMKLHQDHPQLFSIKTQISRSVHVEGDPNLDCAVYTEENSYSKCAQKELFEVFRKEIDCVPPLLEEDPQKMCNRNFNLSKAKDKYINELFKPLYFHNRKFECKTPCTKNVYASKFVHTSPVDSPGIYMYICIVFDEMLDVVHSSFSINEQTLLTRLGGSVSSGRTLLWILATILAAFQVSLYKICGT